MRKGESSQALDGKHAVQMEEEGKVRRQDTCTVRKQQEVGNSSQNSRVAVRQEEGQTAGHSSQLERPVAKWSYVVVKAGEEGSVRWEGEVQADGSRVRAPAEAARRAPRRSSTGDRFLEGRQGS